MQRGAFIIFEGVDRAGKSTQVNLLVQALKRKSICVEQRAFPERKTAIGGIIDDYLKKNIELAPEAVNLLFSANRWECKDKIQETLQKGITLIVDRYAASGAAYYAATTGKSMDWYMSLDTGLPAPDLVVFLDMPPDVQEQRANWGGERYEVAKTQLKVAENFHKLAKSSTWNLFDASRPIEELHQDILNKTLAVVEDCKDKPIKLLYES